MQTLLVGNITVDVGDQAERNLAGLLAGLYASRAAAKPSEYIAREAGLTAAPGVAGAGIVPLAVAQTNRTALGHGRGMA